jgi:hypothetical protein
MGSMTLDLARRPQQCCLLTINSVFIYHTGRQSSAGQKQWRMAAAPALLLILHAKAAFIEQNIAAGRVPSAPQTASFIREAVAALGPHTAKASPAVRNALKQSFSLVGWDVLTNAPAGGSTGPPTPTQLLELFQRSFADLRPTLKATRDAAAAAAKALADERRELAFVEEDAAEGSSGAKVQKKLDSLRQRVSTLEATVEAAGALATAVEAASAEGEAASLDQAEVEAEQQRAARVAAMTSAAGGSGRAGGTHDSGRGRGRGGASRGGRGRGGQAAAAAAAPAPAYASGGGGGGGAPPSPELSADVSIVEASSLRKGGYVLLNDRPCRIKDLSTAKTGKHGHSKVKIAAVDCASGKKIETFCPSSSRMQVPGRRWIDSIAPPQT